MRFPVEKKSKPLARLSCLLPFSGRHILGIAIFFVSVGWAFRMIRCIFNAFHCCGFYSLICVGQFFHRFFIRIANFREPLRTHALSSAVNAHLRRIVAKIVQLGLQIAFSLGRALIGFEPVAFIWTSVCHPRFIALIRRSGDPVIAVFRRHSAPQDGGNKQLLRFNFRPS